MVGFLTGIKIGIDEEDRLERWRNNHNRKGGQINDQTQCILSE